MTRNSYFRVPFLLKKLRSLHDQKWLNDIQAVPKLRTYRIFKQEFLTEKYVSMDIPKHKRSAMAMSRCGVRPLRIETGRYKGESLEDRICIFCDNNEIETEKHFLLHCPSYKYKRNELFGKLEICNASNLTLDDNLFKNLIVSYPRKVIYQAYKMKQSNIQNTF